VNQTVPVAEATSDEAVLPERVQEALGVDLREDGRTQPPQARGDRSAPAVPPASAGGPPPRPIGPLSPPASRCLTERRAARIRAR
jgi:hypothetical protein